MHTFRNANRHAEYVRVTALCTLYAREVELGCRRRSSGSTGCILHTVLRALCSVPCLFHLQNTPTDSMSRVASGCAVEGRGPRKRTPQCPMYSIQPSCTVHYVLPNVVCSPTSVQYSRLCIFSERNSPIVEVAEDGKLDRQKQAEP